MMKRFLAVGMAAVMAVSLCACSGGSQAPATTAAQTEAAKTEAAGTEAATEASAGDYKIGIMTTTVSQSE